MWKPQNILNIKDRILCADSDRLQVSVLFLGQKVEWHYYSGRSGYIDLKDIVELSSARKMLNSIWD